MKRKIYDQLLLWKNKRKGKSAMMIEGARRVGKSYTEGRGGMRNDRVDGEFYRDKANIKPWEVTDFSATGARERRLIQKSKKPKGNLISTAEFYAVNG